MGKRDDLIARYADDLKTICGTDPDMNLLTQVTIGCGPSIYDADAGIIAASNAGELETVRVNFLTRKLGLPDDPALQEGIDAVIKQYGTDNRHKYRPVFYYLLVRHFGKEALYT